ncbi:MAG TPA: phosphotransferase family protein [Mycobacteriales bacterium]|jgi:aminoglycoside phosphotransferase (APT) family kinase protein|nr:phosphotransferase family protein [Mycobacteriales bacterium]
MDVPGADPRVLGPYLAGELGDDAWLEPAVEVVPGGRSNLTYFVTSPAGELVLRRPPLRAVRPTAHDMGREHRMLSALYGTAVPVPEPLLLCDDPAVLGAPFYVMRRVPGVVVRAAFPAGYAAEPADRAAITATMIDVLADLHAVDPAAVGLAGYGRPEGYLARQLKRWSGEWQALRSGDLPAVDALAAELGAGLPDAPSGGIVHGDYKLDNVILAADDPGRIEAVLDWEMSTLGDPLADLGLLVVYWQPAGAAGAVVPSVTGLPGFPSRTELAARYAARTGRDVSALPWYVAFGYFKLACVVAGIVVRQRAGAMADNTDDGLGDAIGPLAEAGLDVLGRSTTDLG